jgi:hypothetical protein
MFSTLMEFPAALWPHDRQFQWSEAVDHRRAASYDSWLNQLQASTFSTILMMPVATGVRPTTGAFASRRNTVRHPFGVLFAPYQAFCNAILIIIST